METIVAAAIKVRPFVSPGAPVAEEVIISAPPPHRHHHLIYAGYTTKGNKSVGPQEQGFLTSSGRFVDRVEGMQIARACGQPFNGEHKVDSTYLFSEHLW